MNYKSLNQCLSDLEKHGHLIRIKELVDPELEMAAIHLRVHEAAGPAILYENIKGCKFKAVSNLFGSLDRSRFIFRNSLQTVKKLIELKNDPILALKNPFKYAGTGISAINALPLKTRNNPVLFKEITIKELPLIKCWPMDGGAFITLPQVYTEDIEKPGVMNSNLGMYRIQLNGNDYVANKEIGLHYQLHRGIGVHQTKANKKGEPLKTSIFVGGPPAHSLSAVMPLPEALSELTFAGVMGNRRFRYSYKDGYCISSDADFVITGDVYPGENKPEGPFGDHLGYYSLEHNFPLMKVKAVYHRKDAIWPFTVVGRPPQEDTSFGALIHEITGPLIPKEIPGLIEVNAVDAAGVHPLLLAIGSERYTPYIEIRKPQEILTIANHILGFGQMSLAKYLIIVAGEDNPSLKTHDIKSFFSHVLERVDWKRDLHFYTKTSIDTLDYSGTGLNSGSKVVIAAAGEKKRELATELPHDFILPNDLKACIIIMPGVIAISGPNYKGVNETLAFVERISGWFKNVLPDFDQKFPLIILCDDSRFTSATLNNFLWVTFTRSNPSHDIYGVDSFTQHKHWGCTGSLIIDARSKPHHAPPLYSDPSIEKKVDALGEKGASLFGII
ncbi:MAG: UbiD family decarboxylase [Bacteroidetes bacterium]|nr:UbiD family decarboxylase [Bacteroidota bacterium]HET6245824.1 UbiD family decarboxylase [Bacteroidia bacterium]